MEKLSKMERAKQFAPFASLRGYGEIIRNKERSPMEKRELTDEELTELNEIVSKLKKGDMIEAVYYSVDRYKDIQGVITAIDKVMRYITIVKTTIPFDDLLSIKEI